MSVDLPAHRLLPGPRRSSLIPGSSKESSLTQYVDSHIDYIQRRFANPSVPSKQTESSNAVPDSDINGYSSFQEVADDMSRLVDVIWTCSTPSLQIPYLLHIALLVSAYIPALPVSKKAMFMLLKKLDLSFASLLTGYDKETGIALPWHGSNERGVSETEKVRIASLVEKTRVVIVNTVVDDEIDLSEDEDEDEDFQLADSSKDLDAARDAEEMAIAHVYEKTLQELGDTLDSDTPK